MLLLRTLCMLILLLLSVQLTATDQHAIDSLKSRIEEDIADSTRARLLINLAEELGASDTVYAYSSLERAREIVESLNDLQGMGRYYKVLGKIHARCGHYDQAILYYDRALAYFSEADDQLSFFETIKNKGNVHLFRSEYSQAMNQYELALDYYRKNNNVIGISRCLNNMGIIHKNRGDYVEALSVYHESVVYLDSIRNANDISQAYINMGNLFVLLGGYERALEYYAKALEISEQNNYLHNISLSLSNSGVIQNKIGNYSEAHNLYQRSLDVSRSLNDPVQISNCLINIGTNYADMGKPEKGLEYVHEGLAIKTELGDDRTISNCYIHLADIYSIMKDYEKAIELFKTAIPFKEQLDDPEGLIRCYLGLGSGALEQGDFAEAVRMTDMALEIALEIRAMEHLAQAYLIKREIAIARGDYRMAYQFEMQQHLYTDSLMDEATAKAAMEMEFRLRSRVLQQENENLRIQSNLDQLQVRKRTFIFHSSLVIVSILILALIFVLYFMRRHKKTSLKLEEKNLVITRQNLKLDQVNKTKDRMMSIIAHDLRGTIGNQLTAVDVLNKLESSPSKEIDKAKLLSNLKHSASYSLELLENLLQWSRLEDKKTNFMREDINLGMVMRSCVSLFDESARVKGITIQNSIQKDFSLYADKIMLETIVRNLLSNAIKFSGADSTILISAEESGENLIMKIKDEGVGMKPEQLEKILNNGGYSSRGTANEKGAGIGMTLIREFTSLHGGRLSIESEEGKGSCVFIEFPLKAI